MWVLRLCGGRLGSNGVGSCPCPEAPYPTEKLAWGNELVQYLAGTRFGGPFDTWLPIQQARHEAPAVGLILVARSCPGILS
jgi:hypothetical protein